MSYIPKICPEFIFLRNKTCVVYNGKTPGYAKNVSPYMGM